MWISYVARQVVSFFFTLMRMVPIAVTNRLGRTKVPQTGDVVISMTSHGVRLSKVHYTIESLVRGYVKAPIILWLDRDDYDSEWPAPLRRLVNRGVQVRCSDGEYGPHTKYWNQFRELYGTGARVATVDDDIIYPEWFLERLLFVSDLRPDVVVAYRAHRIELTKTAMRPYVKWSSADTCTASILHFATGVSGVLYPPTMVDYVVEQGDIFQQLTPRADDVWLHACALRSGHAIRQVFAKPRNFAVIPTTQTTGLVIGNTVMGGNDEQIRSVYTQEDVEQLLEASRRED